MTHAGLAPPPHQTPDQQHWFAQLTNAIKMVVQNQSGLVLRGKRLLLWKALDASKTGEYPILIPRAPYNAGSISGSVALDFTNGGTQRATLSDDLTITDISNLDAGAWMNLRFDNSGTHTLTFHSDAFEGPTLVFTEATIWCSVVDFGVTKLAIMGGGV